MSLVQLAIIALIGWALLACGVYWRRSPLSAIGLLAGGFGTGTFFMKWLLLGLPFFGERLLP